MYKRIFVLHGPNLNLLGEREPAVYGTTSLYQIDRSLKEKGKALGVTVECFQSNHEGQLIDRIHEARGTAQGIIINAGALTHYSLALRDALQSVDLPVLEVHLSNIFAREAFRACSVISPVARGVVCGLGPQGYLLALEAMVRIISGKGDFI